MAEQTEDWSRLDPATNEAAWDRIVAEFNFRPSVDPHVVPFDFPVPVDVYDISGSPLFHGDQTLAALVDAIFSQCIRGEDYMMLLDWQHDGARLDPRLPRDEPATITLLDGEGRPKLVHPPEYFPWGDYYFYVARDLSWGYLTHPWLVRAWVYGQPLMTLMRQHASELGFVVLN